jgi:hypothetical protein
VFRPHRAIFQTKHKMPVSAETLARDPETTA